jgi:hypothetical protein
MNRMRSKSSDGKSWTTVRVRELRERLGIAPFDPTSPQEAIISVDKAADRLKLCIGSVLLKIHALELVDSLIETCLRCRFVAKAKYLEQPTIDIGRCGVRLHRSANCHHSLDGLIDTCKVPAADGAQDRGAHRNHLVSGEWQRRWEKLY